MNTRGKKVIIDPRRFVATPIEGLVRGLKGQDRGRYFVVTPTGPRRLISRLNSPEMFEEIETQAAPHTGTLHLSDDVSAALAKGLHRARERARNKNRELDITLDDLFLLYHQQRGLCALTWLPMRVDGDFGSTRNPWAPSIDRVDQKRGYTLENVQLTVAIANIAKSDFGETAFLNMCANATLYRGLLQPAIPTSATP